MCYSDSAMKTLLSPQVQRRDIILVLATFVVSFLLYLRTLAPSVVFIFDDTLELQYVVPRLGILHPTGYPLYTLLGNAFTLLVPLGDMAYRLNLFSALNGALAAAVVYVVLRHLASYRIAALIGALVFALGQTFWSQAVAAEIYTMQMLIVAVLLYLALIWREEVERGNTTGAQRRFLLLALVMGLGLAHHRLIVLLYPALALYILLVDRNLIKDGKLLARAAVLFVLPLALYVYLPLRGAVGSANGEYQNTLSGFWTWVTAQEYMDFITQNPLQVHHGIAFYWTLFSSQFTLAGLALVVVGVVWLLQRPREWLLLAASGACQALFVFNYRVADVEVHFLTIFLLTAVLIGVGADGLLTVYTRRAEPVAKYVFLAVSSLLLLLIPLNLLIANYATNDLSTKWDVHDYALDMLNQPLEKNATVVGILGEMTLLRYFQETQGIRPDIQTIAADKPEARLAAVDRALEENRVVYLTRPLEGIETKYSPSSLGPLVRVNPAPVPADENAQTVGENFGAGIGLVGWDVETMWLNPVPGRWHAEAGRRLRVTLRWLVQQQIPDDATVSVKVMRRDRRIIGQIDRRPVLDAYPTTAWRPGELVLDTYDVPIFLGAVQGEYTLNVTMYVGKTGAIIGQRDLGPVTLAPDVVAPRRDTWNMAHMADADFGAFALEGYSLDGQAPVRPGDQLPLTFLWRAGQEKIANSLVARVWLEDGEGKVVASRDVVPGSGFPVQRWQPNQYVRDWPVVRIPANVVDGKYTVKLAASRNNQFLGAEWFPFGATVTRLGQVTIKNRPRVMLSSPIANALEAVFDQKIRLLGYELKHDVPQRGVQLTLYWKSLALMDTSYAVFVHVLDGKDNVILSADAVPGAGAFPTSGWIENEYITDIHAFTLPPDLPEEGYPIEIGLYDPTTGKRLKMPDGNDHIILTSVNSP